MSESLHERNRRALTRALRRILPEDAILTEKEDLRPFECDGLSAYRALPLIVVLPETVEQVQAVLELCHVNEVPVARFDRILEIDTANRTAVVQPGVTNLSVSEAAAPHGLFYAPDPSSQIACTLGGNVAENSGGVHCLKYGLTVHNVLGIEMLTMEGERLRLGGKTLDAPGYDLLAVMHGSEGLLGIITEITLRLLPKPPAVQVLLAAFDSIAAAGDAVGRILGAGIVPAGLEMMDNPSLRAAEDFVHAGYPVDAAAILLCELDGCEAEIAHLTEQVSGILAAAGATEVRVARNDAEKARFWAGRKAAFPAELSEKHGLPVANVFHAGDGNLHPLILYDANRPGELQKAEAFGGEILELCVAVGGTITGEHGVGRPACSTRARPSPPCTAAPSSAPCTCITGSCPIPSWSGSDGCRSTGRPAGQGAGRHGQPHAALHRRQRQQGLSRPAGAG